MKFTKPFPHTIIDGFADPGTVARINAEWPDEWTKEDGKANRKWSTPKLPPAAAALAESITPAMVEEFTGIRGLFVDPDLFGGGLHCIPRGGFLKMHVDFNRHPKGWHRRVNLLVYLNQEWRDEWGGHLELGLNAPRKKIAPLGGRCVVFETTGKTWHGHPNPLECPEDVQRRSMALYFYTEQPPDEPAHSTIYQRRAA